MPGCVAFVGPPSFAFVLVDGVVWTRMRKNREQWNEQLFDSSELSATSLLSLQ